MTKTTVILLIIGGVMLSLASCGVIMSARVEKPQYDILKADRAFEIRRYDPMIVAETKVQGDRSQAIRDGFQIIADYIFGENVEKRKIDMTAPVMQSGTQQTWTVQFVMPKEFTMESLPEPLQGLVTLQETPSKTYVVIKFSGRTTTENVMTHQQELQQYIEEKGLKVTGDPLYAFYNPPWTLPMFRRNEVMFELAKESP
ncbi:MAG: SOUL family heme-binding protein [Alphaproteobacteria bacterium]